MIRDASLMRQVLGAVKQSNSNRLEGTVADPIEQAVQLTFIKICNDLAASSDPSRNTKTIFARDQWRNRCRLKVMEIRSVLPPDIEQIFEAALGDQCSPGKLSLEQRIGRHGRSVNHLIWRKLPQYP